MSQTATDKLDWVFGLTSRNAFIRRAADPESQGGENILPISHKRLTSLVFAADNTDAAVKVRDTG